MMMALIISVFATLFILPREVEKLVWKIWEEYTGHAQLNFFLFLLGNKPASKEHIVLYPWTSRLSPVQRCDKACSGPGLQCGG